MTPPRSPRTPHPPTSPSHVDPFDELAALFLSESGHTTAAAGHAHDAKPAGALTFTELLVVGHLPVRANLWLTPYADAMAQQHGATGLLRLDDIAPSLELFAMAGPADPNPRALRDTIAALPPAQWIIKPPLNTSSADLIAAGADRITILSSADEAAVVAAYTLVKELVEAADHAGCELPAVGVAILGAEETRGAITLERLNRTTSTYLGFELPLVANIQQIDALIKSSAYVRFNEASPEPDRLGDLVTWIELHRRRTPAPTVAAPRAVSLGAAIHDSLRHAAPIGHDELDALHAVGNEETDSAEAITAETLAGKMAASHAANRASVTEEIRGHASSSAKVAPKPAGHIEPKFPAAAHEPDDHGVPIPLAGYVPGLNPIAARCPNHERIELAVDSSGVMHLLGREDDLRTFTIVENWARAHRELIAMAFPQLHFDFAAKPVCHIFTDTPARIADLHGSALRLHLLAQVSINGQVGWFATPLN